MIIKAKSRSGPGALAAHLGNAEKNERVQLIETRGTVANDLRGALIEMDALAAGTRCEKPLYHAAISPEQPYRLTPEQRMEAVDALEAKLGLTGHARVVVVHEKLGREHIHVVWSRINLHEMKAVSDGYNYRKHEEVARDLERRFGHPRTQGAHHEREGVERPDRTPSRAELRQEERTGIKGKDMKAEVSAIFKASDGPAAFQAALEDRGYLLAKGDRRDFVIVDQRGGVHSLARRLDDMKAADLRTFMEPLDRTDIRGLEEAKTLQLERARQRDEDRERAHIRAEDRRDAAFARSEDYVTQSTAALKLHQQRQKEIDQQASRDSLWHRIETGEAAREGRDREEKKAREQGEAAQQPADGKQDYDVGNIELTAEMRERLDRLLSSSDGPSRSRYGPDRQPGASGGGRTRSR